METIQSSSRSCVTETFTRYLTEYWGVEDQLRVLFSAMSFRRLRYAVRISPFLSFTEKINNNNNRPRGSDLDQWLRMQSGHRRGPDSRINLIVRIRGKLVKFGADFIFHEKVNNNKYKMLRTFASKWTAASVQRAGPAAPSISCFGFVCCPVIFQFIWNGQALTRTQKN
ncbi:hypothetical protein BC828DRAFT_247498 [Blastocladiella britannica]|nr:hypothetical protein BC828DRAFT_247498 [Blastocladiella britannica]